MTTDELQSSFAHFLLRHMTVSQKKSLETAAPKPSMQLSSTEALVNESKRIKISASLVFKKPQSKFTIDSYLDCCSYQNFDLKTESPQVKLKQAGSKADPIKILKEASKDRRCETTEYVQS
jgi:hypothetical protein